MATIATVSNGNYLNSARRQYITLAAFQNDIFRYVTTMNPQTYVTTGSLTSLATVGTATAANSPANRILRENGKKLYPSGILVANSTTVPGPYPGVTTYMVGVYDMISGLSGFIDPNSQVFALYNGDKPNYVPRGIDPKTGAVDQGEGVLTLGSVTAGTTVYAGTAIGFGGVGYPGIVSVTQQTNKETAVEANSPVVDITMNNAVLNAQAIANFTLTNSFITANDNLVITHVGGAGTTFGGYILNARVSGNNTAIITIRNATPSTNLSEAIVLRVLVLHS